MKMNLVVFFFFFCTISLWIKFSSIENQSRQEIWNTKGDDYEDLLYGDCLYLHYMIVLLRVLGFTWNTIWIV